MGAETGWIQRLAMIVCVATAAAGCQSGRFGGGARAPVVASARSAPAEPPSEPTVAAVPSGSVTSEPLGPPPGSEVQVMPGGPRPVETLGGGGAPASAPAGPSSRSAAIGGWTAREATGTTCKVNLSSTPSLDLYRASAGGCANKDLARITAWDFRDGEVYLYQPGGAVAARLRSSHSGLSGVLAKSGAPLSLTRS
ncbi:AprI/Inh family metalloprotease inhibitor [uncultured Enterovirga sp.]|uniref:AprI/Inh family metalloprotease inhibitor n=1 Tax=uncultured Enterovirga sp. TaxID=2026352 RepID=UPI0035CC2BAE